MNLTEHLLISLTAECAAVTTSAATSLRLGPDNSAPLTASLNDLMGVIWLLETNGIIPLDWQDYPAQSNKMRETKTTMREAAKTGALQLDRELL